MFCGTATPALPPLCDSGRQGFAALNPPVGFVMSGAEHQSSDQPEGCTCTVVWHDRGNPDGFEWYYETACPVAREQHTALWRDWFRTNVFGLKRRWGMTPEGAFIMVDRDTLPLTGAQG